MVVTDNPNGDGTGTVIVHEQGHDYWLSEPESFSYYWDLVTDIYHPMVINGVTTMLVQVNAADVPGDMPSDNNIKYTDTDSTVYYRFNNKVYKVTSDTNCVLQGTNYRRSNLNLTKTISEAHPMDDYFEYEAVVTSSTNEKIWFSAINKEKPILLTSGAEDPVGEHGKGVKSVYDTLKAAGANVELKLYKGCRHEILNDFDKEEVTADIIEFVNK